MRAFPLCVAVLVFISCVSAAPDPPILPTAFTCEFTEFTAANAGSPPYVNGVPPLNSAPFFAGSGRTYYDWNTKNMIEQRFDYCVNIFGYDNRFPCNFTNVNGTSYLISRGASHLPPCCVFGQPWSPPPPDFLRNKVRSVYSGTVPWGGTPSGAAWFEVPDIAPPTGPFFYSFNTTDTVGTIPQFAVYSSFAFPGVDGWVQQVFHDVRVGRPSPAVFDLPSECLPVASLPNCGFFSHKMMGWSP